MSTALAPPSTESRRARTAVAALFLTNGALFANLIPRFPEIKADLALDNAAYGVAIAAFPAGAAAPDASIGRTSATSTARCAAVTAGGAEPVTVTVGPA